MAKLDWGPVANRFYEAGVDRGVFYPQNSPAVVWTGLISVAEGSSGGDVMTNYMDGTKFRVNQDGENFTAAITAFMYPDEFSDYDGMDSFVGQQERKTFGFSYRTMIGNGDGTSDHYKIHLVYNSLVQPTSRSYVTLNDSNSPSNFSWNLTTSPVLLPSARPSAHLIIDTRVAHPWTVAAIEDILYGSDGVDGVQPKFPTVDEIIEVFEENAILRITDHGDGTWTAEGPDEAIVMLDPTTFRITWPSAIYIDDVTYTISSL